LDGGVVAVMEPTPQTSPEELRRLYAELGPALLAYARSITLDVPAAQDALHGVFLRLLDRPAAAIAEPRPYLFRAVRNEALNARRKSFRERSGQREAWLLAPHASG